MAREWYAQLRTFGGISLEYCDLTETDFTDPAGAAYSPPERGSFRRIAGSRQIQLLQESPGVLETFQTSSAEIFLPANTVADLTNDAGNGRIYFVKNSGTGDIVIKDYLGTTLWNVQEKGAILVVGNDNNNWDFYFKAENIFYDNSNSSLTSDNVKDAIDELSATASVSASPGFTWGKGGSAGPGEYLYNDQVESNKAGRLVPLENGEVVKFFVNNDKSNGTKRLQLRRRRPAQTGSWVTIAEITLPNGVRADSFTVSAPVELNDELAVRVRSGSADFQNPIVGIIIKGTVS